MAKMAQWQGYPSVSCAFLLAVTGAYVTSYAVPYWTVALDGEYWGLWQYCRVEGGTETCIMWTSMMQSMPGRLKAAQVLLTVALIPLVASFMCHLIWMRTSDPSAAYRASRTAVTCSLIAGILGGTGALVFGKEYSSDPATTNGWAFWLGTGASAGMVVHAIIFAFWACREPSKTIANQEKVMHSLTGTPALGGTKIVSPPGGSPEGIPAPPALPPAYTDIYQPPSTPGDKQ